MKILQKLSRLLVEKACHKPKQNSLCEISAVIKIIHTIFLFRLNDDGDVTTVRYSNEVRDSFTTGYTDDVINYYKALKLFDSLAHHPNNRIVYKLKEGKYLTAFLKSTFSKQLTLRSKNFEPSSQITVVCPN
jgi:hypothetical protein